MASANHGNAGRRKSSVWDDFHCVSVSGAAGACAMATCNRCGTTLQADSKKHGTSHLRRHANSSCSAKRAAERDAKWVDGLLVEPEFDLARQLVDAGRGSHVAAAGDDGGRLSPDFIPDALPQAPSSSSSRFFRKKRESRLTRHKSSVWNDFNVSGGTGASAIATCKRCGTTLRASAKKHGTSHLRRHAKSSCSVKRAAVREAAPASDAGLAKWVEDLRVVPEVDFAGRLIIERRDERVDADGHAPAAGDHGRLSPNFIPDALPQAPSSSSSRFFMKKRERSASLASHEGETADNDHPSRAKDLSLDMVTFDKSIVGINLAFGDGDCFALALGRE